MHRTSVYSSTCPSDITLAAGSVLSLDDVQIAGAALSLTDSPEDQSGAHLVVAHSTFTGTAGAGLWIRLRDATDKVQITGSTFDYPNYVWIKV